MASLLKSVTLSFLCLSLSATVFAQAPIIDSLKNELLTAKEDTSKVLNLVQLAGYLNLYSNPNVLLYNDSAMNLSKILEYDRGIALAHRNFANHYSKTGEYDKAHENFQQALKILENSWDKSSLVKIYLGTGIAFLNQGELDKALEAQEKALDLSRKIKDRAQESACYVNIGNILWRKSDYVGTLDSYLKGIKIKEELKDSLGIGKLTANIGHVHNAQKNYPEAIKYLEKAKKIFQEQQFTIGIAGIAQNLGNIYIFMEEFDKAIENLLVAQEIFENMNHSRGLAGTYGNLGQAYMFKKDYDKALFYHEKTLGIHSQTGNKSGISSTKYSLAQIYHDNRQYTKAIKYCKESLAINEETGERESMMKRHHLLAKSYSDIQDYGMSLHHYEKYMNLKDSLYNEEKNLQIAEMETKYETEKKDAEIARLEKETARKELEAEKQRTLRNRTIWLSLLTLLALTALFQYFRNRQRLKRKEAELALELEHAEAEKLRELDQMKSTFFANISHEFRTPLTLIKSPLNDLISGTFKGNIQKYYRTMSRNADRLLQLVNQLLDLSRLESGKLELKAGKGDINRFIRTIAYSFESLAFRKGIDYRVDVPVVAHKAWFDTDKLEKILTNLLSNAFKFTPEEGKITIRSAIDAGKIAIDVVDNGAGISEEQLPYIFERFYKSDTTSDLQASSGIGLALTKELVGLHHGSIGVTSKENERTVFTIVLPIDKAAFADSELSNAPIEPALRSVHKVGDSEFEPEHSTAGSIHHGKEKPSILISEDNPDVREYIADQLGASFQVISTEDGRKGLEKALEIIPDLVITDIMMPQMDGKELTRHLKTNEKTSHIPVIMLTALGDQPDRILGLETGADDYLVKPFDSEELLVRIRNLIEQRKKLREKYQGSAFQLKPGEVTVNSVDAAFLQKVIESIEANMDDENFSIEDLARSVRMSRYQLNRKIKALTDQSPSVFMRGIRLERAMQLLKQHAGNASEIAYEVGFNSPSYFTKCFQEQFGLSPSEVLKQD